MKVSIITVTYNSAETIEDTLKSVLKQDYSDIEYIIIDGASTDATLAILGKYKDNISILISEKDVGIYDALNKGVQHATGDVVAILHSDDFYAHSQVISDYVKVFTETQAQAVYADLHYVDRVNVSKIVRNWVSGDYKKHSFYWGWMPPHPTFVVKRELYSTLGLFNLKFKSAADYELMLRFVLKGAISIAYLKEVTVKMRTGGQSNITLTNRINANREDRMAWKQNGLRPGFFTLYLKPIRKLFQFF
jgi:glycosyltransferase